MTAKISQERFDDTWQAWPLMPLTVAMTDPFSAQDPGNEREESQLVSGAQTLCQPKILFEDPTWAATADSWQALNQTLHGQSGFSVKTCTHAPNHGSVEALRRLIRAAGAILLMLFS